MNMIKQTFDNVPCKIASKNERCCGVTGQILPETKQQIDDRETGYEQMFSLWRKVPQRVVLKNNKMNSKATKIIETEDMTIHCLLQLQTQGFPHAFSHTCTEGNRILN